mgnify:CR=1 FL=1
MYGNVDGDPALFSISCSDGFHPNGARDSETGISNFAGSRQSLFLSTVVDFGVVRFGVNNWYSIDPLVILISILPHESRLVDLGWAEGWQIQRG